MLACLIILRLR